MDPAHIAPSRSDANSNGHFPPANGHMPAGTPRGFNLQNFGLPQMPGFAGQGNFQQFLANNAMQNPMGWSVGDPRGGPVRRGGRQYPNNARTGPYDRRPRDQRWGAENGRLSPPPGARRGGAMASGGGRWGDGAAGGAAVGPREAVQGRSLKSYEDLDAVAGGGAGELNY
jgi:hypothetical protein